MGGAAEQSIANDHALEMNGNWFPWCGVFQGGSTTTAYGDPTKADGPERYVDAFRHIVNVFRGQEVNNVTWYFHLNSPSLPETSWNAMTAYYPGDGYVDWIGVSVYGTQYRDEGWESFDTIMEAAYNELAPLLSRKPLMLPEWGVGEWPEKGDKATWYREAFNHIQSTYTEIKIAVVYHEAWQNDDGTITDLRVNSSPEALQAYQQGIRSGYFLGHIE